jgi:hypothetical protein
MGQRRRDQEWPRPRNTRHVWVSPTSTLEAPLQGYVLDWRRHSYRWSALVVTVRSDADGRPVVVQE